MATSAAAPHSNDHSSEPRKIIVGVDGSPSSLEALSWAVRQAKLVGAQVHAVIAWEYPAVYASYVMTDAIDWADNARQVIETAVKEAMAGDVDAVESHVVQGHAAQVLVGACAGAELLVVGNRGHGGFAETLLGSVSEQVVTHAPCPVLVVRAQATREPPTLYEGGLAPMSEPGQAEDGDNQDWPTHCTLCGAKLTPAVIDLDTTNENRVEFQAGEMVAIDYCPNPDCPGKN